MIPVLCAHLEGEIPGIGRQHREQDGEEADVLWRQCDGPSTGDVFYEFSGVEEARAWVKEHNQSQTTAHDL